MATPAATPSIDTVRERLRAMLPHLQATYAVEHLALHGSYLRGEATPSSDLDVLVTFQATPAGRRISLLDMLALKHELEDRLGVPVDLGEAAALRGPAAERILKDAEPI
jgi:hypothetical protein